MQVHFLKIRLKINVITLQMTIYPKLLLQMYRHLADHSYLPLRDSSAMGLIRTSLRPQRPTI